VSADDYYNAILRAENKDIPEVTGKVLPEEKVQPQGFGKMPVIL
jgi:hypothetical protein